LSDSEIISTRQIDAKAAEIIRDVTRLAAKYGCVKTESNGDLRYTFIDNQGDPVIEYSFPKAEYPAFITLLNKITARIGQEGTNEKNSNSTKKPVTARSVNNGL
jgi:hypothetical protein